VQKAIMAMMRLCQRLLPYKTDISEPLMKGIQLVALVDDQVSLGAWGRRCSKSRNGSSSSSSIKQYTLWDL
jgi:hypothetical protein